jgi:Cu-Zn family superoxide dismutase
VKQITNVIVAGAIALIVTLVGVGVSIHTPALADTGNLAQGTGTTAKATMMSTDESSTVLGEAVFTEVPGGVDVNVSLNNVPPGYHGLHIHEFGSCDEGGTAAGGHFNPLGVKHGYIVTDGYENAHVGGLGNIFIYEDGSGTLSLTVPDLPLTDDERAIVDHAVILHAERDDFGQPTGNAGGRIGCGIIELES